MKPAPEWLAALQAEWGNTIRTPLDRSTGTLRAREELYPESIVNAVRTNARARIAVYNRQYWFRLFGVAHTAFPITTRLLGHWAMNEYVARFLHAHPPHDWDLDRALDGFAAFAPTAFEGHRACDALIEAAQLDETWHVLLRAPAVVPYHPSASDAARLLTARLVRSPAAAVWCERWPMMALRRTLGSRKGEAAVSVPELHTTPQWWLLLRESAGLRSFTLDAREGELLQLLTLYPVHEALALLEARCSEQERLTLPASTQLWLARSVERGVWSGLEG